MKSLKNILVGFLMTLIKQFALDESVDLGFVDKVVDSVLREIVWDFDRGIVYFL